MKDHAKMLVAFAGVESVAKAARIPVPQVNAATHSGRVVAHVQAQLEGLDLEDLEGSPLLSSKGSVLRLRALYATGYSTQVLGEMLGIGRRSTSEVLAGERPGVRGSTHRKVKALFSSVQMLPGPEGDWADTTRERARGKGWLRPIELEEDLLDVPQPWASQMLMQRAQEMPYSEKIRCMRAVKEGERSEIVKAGYEAYKTEYQQRKQARGQS